MDRGRTVLRRSLFECQDWRLRTADLIVASSLLLLISAQPSWSADAVDGKVVKEQSVTNAVSGFGGGRGRATATPSTDAAAPAYATAIEELRQGRQVAGQRRLEALIAQHPDSPFAEAARAKVVELYTARTFALERSNLGVPHRPPPPGAKEWQVEVMRSPTVADEFRRRVGDRVFFASGSAELGARARSVLKAQAEWLRRYPTVTLTIEGHADDPGGMGDNLDLAQRRAEAVRQRLVEEGVAVDRIEVAVLGNSRRLALCDEAMCSAQNRRVISVLHYEDHAEPAVARNVAPRLGRVSR